MSYVFEQLTKTNEFQDFMELSNEMECKRKPNPNNYPIVDKWNYKYVYLPYQSRLYRTVEAVFNVGFPAAYEAEIENFADVNDVDIGDRYYGEEQELP